MSRPPTALRKKLTYRDQTGTSREAHQEHWRGFRYISGPTVVKCYGSWGELQVWATSVEEGARVIRHAASIAGLPVDDPDLAEWNSHVVTAQRYQRRTTVQVVTHQGIPVVTRRAGSNGHPTLAD